MAWDEGSDYDLVPVDHDPFEAAAARLRRPYGKPVAAAPSQDSDVVDTFRSVPRGILTGLAHEVTAMGDLGAIESGQAAPGLTKEQGRDFLEENVTGPLHQPHTRGGRFGEMVGEVLGNPVNWMGPGSVPAKAGWNVASGLASEAGGQLYEGKPEEPIARAVASWGPAVAERAILSGYKFVPSGSAGIFGGRLAQTADHAALAKAEEMAAAGASRDDIWNTTGWFQGADKKWRFEIPDNKARITPKALAQLNETGSSGATQRSASGFMKHDDLYAAYPDARRIDVDARYNAGLSSPEASYNVRSDKGGRPSIDMSLNAIAGPDGPSSMMLHEMQHAVQHREGLASGNNPASNYSFTQAGIDSRRKFLTGVLAEDKAILADASAPAWRKLGLDHRIAKTEAELSDLDSRVALSPMEAYRRYAGEVEARNVQAREHMTPEERRATPPWKTQDVPDEQQIVRMGGTGPQSYELLPVDHDPFAAPVKRATGGRVGTSKPRLNRAYDVPYLAGSSNDNKTVFIDRRVPTKIKVKLANGKGYRVIDPGVPLAIHEQSEHRAMSAGETYEKAHRDHGTVDERAWVEAQWLDWKNYEESMNGMLSHIEHEHPKRPPPALYTKPYPHDKALLLKRLARAE